MDLQRIDLKALVDAPRDVNLDPLLAIFSRWRNDKDHPARWVDLADYAHMSRGAGIVIVGKQGIFGMTRFEPALGLLLLGPRRLRRPYRETRPRVVSQAPGADDGIAA